MWIKYWYFTKYINRWYKIIIPTVLENKNNNEKYFDIYSRLLSENIIFISGEINDDKANLAIAELLYLSSMNNNDIMLYINSPGGSVSAGLAIYDTMNYIKNDVCTIGIGMCASMGAVILSSGTKGKRYALSNTKIMIHQPLGGAKGKASDIQILANEINKTKLNIINILSKNTKKSKNKIQKDIEKDYYMTSLESKNYNLIDKII